MTKRRMLAMIIALVMCVSLSACSGGEPDSDVQSKVGTFIVVEKGTIGNSGVYQYIMYDLDTMAPMTYLFELFLAVVAMPITDKLCVSNGTEIIKNNQKIKSGCFFVFLQK